MAHEEASTLRATCKSSSLIHEEHHQRLISLNLETWQRFYDNFTCSSSGTLECDGKAKNEIQFISSLFPLWWRLLASHGKSDIIIIKNEILDVWKFKCISIKISNNINSRINYSSPSPHKHTHRASEMARGKWTQKVTLKVMKNHTLSCVCLVIQDETKRRGFVCWNFLSHMTQPKEVLRSYHNRQKEETWKLYLVQNGSWITLDDCPGHHATERAFIYQFNLQVFSGYEEKTFRFCLLLIRLIILPFVQLVPGNVCVAYVSAIKLKSSTQQTCERFSRCIRSME